MKNLTDCWWQIPPFGKDFHALQLAKNEEFWEFRPFRDFGTTLV
jgi:hypothetical protein